MEPKWFVFFWNISESELSGPWSSREEALERAQDDDSWDHAGLIQLPFEEVPKDESAT